MRKEIIKELDDLIGKPFMKIGRSHNLTLLNFGKEFELLDRKGTKRIYGEFSFNIQCTWRIIHNSRIVIAYKDIYSPKSNSDEREEFNWESFGSNKFDEKAAILNEKHKNKLIIKDIDADELGGVKITFENGIVFEIFPDESTDTNELWRFINRNNQHHLVVSGEGIVS